MTPHPRLPLQAALFDMDGTLVDTERLWWEAVEQIAGRPLTEADEPEVLGRPVAPRPPPRSPQAQPARRRE
ncbi:hypothetical protein ABT156_49925, partial [Streptomyces sp. NPDC001833]